MILTNEASLCEGACDDFLQKIDEREENYKRLNKSGRFEGPDLFFQNLRIHLMFDVSRLRFDNRITERCSVRRNKSLIELLLPITKQKN